MADVRTIINKIDNHLKVGGGQFYQDFYVGITNDPERRLFKEHKVLKDNAWWIYSKADTSDIAKEVEKHYLELGLRGGTGGGDNDATFVYCYRVTPFTIE